MRQSYVNLEQHIVSNEEVLSLVQEQRSLVHEIKQSQANWIKNDIVLRLRLSFEDCIGREDGRKTDTWKIKKENVKSTHRAKGQEDHFRGARAGSDGAIVVEPTLEQSTP